MSFELVCACGRKLRVASEHMGRRVRCPVCDSILQVPGEITATEPAGGKSGWESVWLILGLLVPLTIGGLLVWWFWGKVDFAGEVADLSLVPADAQAFLSVRVAEVWESAPMQQAIINERMSNPAAPDVGSLLEMDTGLRPEQIERATGVGIDLDSNRGYVVVLTRTTYNRQAILSRLRPLAWANELYHEGERYQMGMDARGNLVALYFVSPRVLVVGSKEAIEHCINNRLRTPPASGPLSPLLSRCETEKPAGLAGVNLTGPLSERLRKTPILSALGEVRLATAVLQWNGNEAQLEVRGQLPDDEEARKLQEAIAPLLGQARGFLALGAVFQPGPQGKALGELGKLLGKLRTRQQGNEVVAELEADAVSVARQALQIGIGMRPK